MGLGPRIGNCRTNGRRSVRRVDYGFEGIAVLSAATGGAERWFREIRRWGVVLLAIQLFHEAVKLQRMGGYQMVLTLG